MTMSDEEWEKLLRQAFLRAEFVIMQELFRIALVRAAAAAAASRSGNDETKKLITKKYRQLSIKFHPDRNAKDATSILLYKTAFQALNESYEKVLE